MAPQNSTEPKHSDPDNDCDDGHCIGEWGYGSRLPDDGTGTQTAIALGILIGGPLLAALVYCLVK